MQEDYLYEALVKVQHFQNPELFSNQILKLAVWPTNINTFKFKWSIVYR